MAEYEKNKDLSITIDDTVEGIISRQAGRGVLDPRVLSRRNVHFDTKDEIITEETPRPKSVKSVKSR